MICEVQFKTLRQETEFSSVDDRVKAVVLLVAFLMAKIWNHQATVTSIQRTPEEQAAEKAKGHTNISDSPHNHWRAADIRLHDFPQKDHVPVLVDTINQAFPRSDGFKTALAHGEGDNFHLHLQVPAAKKF
jgi:hypothetical protein